MAHGLPRASSVGLPCPVVWTRSASCFGLRSFAKAAPRSPAGTRCTSELRRSMRPASRKPPLPPQKRIGSEASPSEKPMEDMATAVPLFLANHRPMATEAMWESIPWPKNRKPQMMPTRTSADVLTAIIRHRADNPRMLHIAAVRMATRSTSPPAHNMITADAKRAKRICRTPGAMAEVKLRPDAACEDGNEKSLSKTRRKGDGRAGNQPARVLNKKLHQVLVLPWVQSAGEKSGCRSVQRVWNVEVAQSEYQTTLRSRARSALGSSMATALTSVLPGRTGTLTCPAASVLSKDFVAGPPPGPM